MKVVFAHDGPLYADERGSYYGVHLNDTLRKRYLLLGDHVTFVMRVLPLANSEVANFSRISNENFSVVSVPNFKSIRLFLKNQRRANQIIKETVKNSDVIVARMPSAIGTLAIEHAVKFNKPYLVEYVACTFDAYWNYSWKGKLVAHYYLWKQKRIMLTVPYTIYVTREFLQKRYPTIGKSISCSNVELKPSGKDVLDKRIGKINSYGENNALVIGTVAALDVRYKGQSDVIQAVAALKRKGFNCTYLLVGQGDASYLRQVIEKHDVSDRVIIIGPLKHDEVFEFYDKIDLYVQPSKQEGLPRALIEAMSRACPAMGANTAGIPELLSPEMIFPKGNVKVIEKLLASVDKDKLVQLAKYNYEVSKEYESEVLYKRRMDFFNKFLKESNLTKS